MAVAGAMHTPAHYAVYPVQPIRIASCLGFCLGNVVRYTLRAPYKGGVEDCDKALEYLRFESRTPQPPMSYFAHIEMRLARERLIHFLCQTPGDALWSDIAKYQVGFLVALGNYIIGLEGLRLEDEVRIGVQSRRERMADEIKELRRVLVLRDTTGQIYEGMSGLPVE